MKVTVILDVDGVLVDLATPVWRAAQAILGKNLPPPEEWMAYDFAAAMGLTSSQAIRMYNTLRKQDNLAAMATWYPGAPEFVNNLLRYGVDVCFVTKPWDGIVSWQRDRESLLRSLFPEQDVLFVAQKHRIVGQHLIDDCVDNIKHNLGRGLLFDRPWNQDAKGCTRVSGYEHALKRILFGEIDEPTEQLARGARSFEQTIAESA